ncbi:MAG: DNA-processing protein DprA [Halothiobacillaceae bacterium]|nr:DNA-processing protein DprA [Halothiobacillaceae bacterium]
MLSDTAAQAWLALIHTPGLGSRRFLRLWERLPDAQGILAAPASLWREAGLNAESMAALRQPDQARIDNTLAWLAEAQRALITYDDVRYPDRLRAMTDPPLALFVMGNIELLHHPSLAIVGTRHPTPGGAQNARAFARDLAGRGVCIASGLAQGIDAEAHHGALEAQGYTLAVVGTGIDRVYPAQHRALAHAIVNQAGLIVSELPLGAPPHPSHFPRRNRIMAALSLGTLVVEAAPQSGSLITARLASELGREVFAIPGSIHNPMARGCHQLIRQGAKLVESSADILEELAGQLQSHLIRADVTPLEGASSALPDLPEEHARLLDAMGFDPVSVDTLVERSGLTAAEVSSILLVTQLQGHISPLAGGLYARSSSPTTQD